MARIASPALLMASLAALGGEQVVRVVGADSAPDIRHPRMKARRATVRQRQAPMPTAPRGVKGYRARVPPLAARHPLSRWMDNAGRHD